MADSSGAGWGVVLPSLAPKVGDIMQQAIARRDRREERDYSEGIRLQERQDQEAKQNRLYNLKEIDSDTDPKNYQTGEQAFDNYSVSELSRIKNNAIQSYINLDPAEMEYRLSKDIADLAKWHGTVKDNIKNVNQQLQEFNKNYPNVDAVKAHNYVYDNLAKDVMERDANGNWTRKSTEFIKPRDYTADLQQPDVLGQLVNDTSPFSKHLNALPKSTISEANYVNNKGFAKKTKWSGIETPYTDITPDANGMPQIGVKHQNIKGVNDVDGKPMKFLDEGIIKDLQGNPQAWAAALGMWQKEKPAIEEKLGRKLEPSEEDFRFKNFLYKQVDQYVPHGIKTEQAQVIPKPPKITINMGAANVNDVYSEISELARGNPYIQPQILSPQAQGIVIDYARKASGDNQLSSNDIKISDRGDGKLQLFTTENGKDTFIGSLNSKSVNLKAQVGAKEKRAVIATKPIKNTPTTTTKTDWSKFKRN